MIENRKILNTSDIDGFDKRKLPSPGFQMEVVLVDFDSAFPSKTQTKTTVSESGDNSTAKTASAAAGSNLNKQPGNSEKADVFSDNESEETGMSKDRKTKVNSDDSAPPPGSKNSTDSAQISILIHETEHVSLGETGFTHSEPRKDAVVRPTSGIDVSNPGAVSDFKVVAADASVFTFGDEEDDYESE